MMPGHECCQMDMNMPEHKPASNLLNSGADWCQCQIVQYHPDNLLALINTTVELHYYPVLLADVELIPEKTDIRPVYEYQFRPDDQVPLFIRNLSLLN